MKNLKEMKKTVKRILRSNLSHPTKQQMLDLIYRESILPVADTEPWAFCEYCLKDDKTGEHIRLKDFHKDWCKILQNEQYIVIWSPHHSGKTTVFSTGWPLFSLGNNHRIRIGLCSKSAGQARKFLLSIMSYIKSDEVGKVFPELKPMPDPQHPWQEFQWSKRDGIIVDRDSSSKDNSAEAFGIGTTIQSAHLDLLILDDVLTRKNTLTRKSCKNDIEWFDNVMNNRVENDGQVIVVGLAWRPYDLMSYLSEKSNWYSAKYSMDERDKGDPEYIYINWEKKHPKEQLEEEEEHNVEVYNKQRRSHVSDESTHIFDIDKIKLNSDIEIPNSWISCTGVDLATKKRPGTAIVTVAMSPDRQSKVLIDIKFGKWSGPDKAKYIGERFDMFKPVKVIVEDNAMQEDNIDWMIASGYRNLPLEGITTTGANKDAYLDSLAVEVRNGLWAFKTEQHKKTCKCDWCRLLSEIQEYPEASTSDGLMALMFANQGIRGKRSQLKVRSASIKGGKILPEKKFDISAYRCYNRISRNQGFDPPKDYKLIVEAIKNNRSLSQWDDEVISYVRDDMERFVRVLNEGK